MCVCINYMYYPSYSGFINIFHVVNDSMYRECHMSQSVINYMFYLSQSGFIYIFHVVNDGICWESNEPL